MCASPAHQGSPRPLGRHDPQRLLGHGSVGARLKRYGYHWRVCGENIAGGSGSKGSSPASPSGGWVTAVTGATSSTNASGRSAQAPPPAITRASRATPLHGRFWGAPQPAQEHGVAASKTAGEILEAVVEDGREELDRASTSVGKDLISCTLTRPPRWRARR